MASTTVFGECSLPANVQPYSSSLSVPNCESFARCTYNPFFLLFTASAFRCLCVPGSVPTYVTANNVTCTEIRGTPCQTNYDCNSRTTDCLGISMANPTFFGNSGTQTPFSSDSLTLLAPLVSVICSFNDRNIVDVTKLYFCFGATSSTLGQCAELGGTIPPVTNINYEDIVFPQALQRDLWRSLLIPRYPGVTFNPNDITTYFSTSTLDNIVPV
ncbi:uncharacterized protein LOC106174675 [Lingula anatina]|nr:uncharacterized protein LOC106174675 [Lingula anatina]|eukprot:XP_013411788.1 uncharacterized protein LOC106174675 [Lingula anatina]